MNQLPALLLLQQWTLNRLNNRYHQQYVNKNVASVSVVATTPIPRLEVLLSATIHREAVQIIERIHRLLQPWCKTDDDRSKLGTTGRIVYEPKQSRLVCNNVHVWSARNGSLSNEYSQHTWDEAPTNEATNAPTNEATNEATNVKRSDNKYVFYVCAVNPPTTTWLIYP